MTREEKKKKAALIAVAYYLEQEKSVCRENPDCNSWSRVGRETRMNDRTVVQRRGKTLRSA